MIIVNNLPLGHLSATYSWTIANNFIAMNQMIVNDLRSCLGLNPGQPGMRKSSSCSVNRIR